MPLQDSRALRSREITQHTVCCQRWPSLSLSHLGSSVPLATTSAPTQAPLPFLRAHLLCAVLSVPRARVSLLPSVLWRSGWGRCAGSYEPNGCVERRPYRRVCHNRDARLWWCWCARVRAVSDPPPPHTHTHTNTRIIFTTSTAITSTATHTTPQSCAFAHEPAVTTTR
jgi:hypothetical protein